MDINLIIACWVGFSLLTSFIAWIKNRSILSWFGISLLLSPLISLVVLIFMPSLDKYEYTGEPSINNEAYKIYLTKQYKIEKIETVNKFQCQNNVFESAIDALRYAQSVDRGIAKEYLLTDDPISANDDQNISGNSTQELKNEKSIDASSKLLSNSNKNVVIKKSKISGFLVAIIAILGIVGIIWGVNKLGTGESIDAQALASRQDVSSYTVDGELAEAFNLNSKYTDIQRENLLQKIKGKLIIWVVEVYEVNKIADNIYRIQTPSGLNLKDDDVGLFIDIYSQSPEESKFLEGLKTGETFRIKGILTGNSLLRSLEVKPAILWYPEDASTSKSADNKIDEENITSAVKFLVRGYKKNGILGATQIVSSCYDEYSKISDTAPSKYRKFEYCISLDLAGYTIDNDSSKINKFPVNEYFELKAVVDRIEKNNKWSNLIYDRIEGIESQINQDTKIALQEIQ